MKLRSWLVGAPLVVLGMVFAVANRHGVAVSLNPFSRNPPAEPMLEGPLWIVLFLALVIGYFIGAGAMWVSGGDLRRKFRERGRRIGALEHDLKAALAKAEAARDGVRDTSVEAKQIAAPGD